jgi:hypothetical protein
VGTKDLAIAKDQVKFLLEERPVGREGRSIRVRSRDAGCGSAHLIGQEGDVAEGDVNAGVGIRCGPVSVEEHLVAAL